MKKIALSVLSLSLALSAICFSACGATKTDLTNAKSLADLKGARIAAQAGTFHAECLKQIEGVKGSTLPDFPDMLIALKSGSIDGYIAEEPTAYAVCEEDSALAYVPLKNNDTGFTATADEVGIAVGLKKGSALKKDIDAILKGISEQTRAELMKQLVKVSQGQSVDEYVLSAAQPENPVGTFKVAMECAYEPYNWTELGKKSEGAVAISGEGKDGMYANGYDVQIARYIAAKLGMKLEIYATVWDSLIPSLQSDTVNAVIAGMSPTDERKLTIDFSELYYTSNLVVIYKK